MNTEEEIYRSYSVEDEDGVHSLDSEPGESSDELYERFKTTFGYYPIRLFGIKGEIEGRPDFDIIWAADPEDEEE